MASIGPLLDAAVVGFCVTVGLMPLARRCALAFGVCAPRSHGEPSGAVPVLGGLPLIAGAMAGAAIAGWMPLWLALPVVFLCLAGVVDDATVLTPRAKLAAELVAALALVAAGPRFTITGWAVLDGALAVFWLVSTANAFNLVDGLDGLAGGIGLIAASSISAAALVYHETSLAVSSIALASAFFGFLWFNFSPASIFMGDSGALPAGMLLGVLALEAGQAAVHTPLARGVFPVVVMLVPLLDTGVVTISRIATGRSISRHGHDHSHHRLLDLGISVRCAVATCWGAQAIFGLAAVMIIRLSGLTVAAFIPFVAMSAAVVALFMTDLTFEAVAPASAYAVTRGLARLVLRAAYQWRMADMLLDVTTITAAYFGAYLIRADFQIPEARLASLLYELWMVLPASYLAFLAAGVYRHIWRYTAMTDAIRFANAAVIAGLLLAACWLAQGRPVSWSVVLLFVLLLFNLLTATRLSFRFFRWGVRRLAGNPRRVLIFGAGRSGAAALQFLASRFDGAVSSVVGFLDDDPFKRGKVIQGKRVLGPLDAIERVYERTNFDEILFAVDELPQERLNALRSFARHRGVAIRSFAFGSQADEAVLAEPSEPAQAAI